MQKEPETQAVAGLMGVLIAVVAFFMDFPTLAALALIIALSQGCCP